MDRLPSELLRIICAHCDVETLRTIRLLSQSFCTYATPELYREVYVGFLSSSFGKLNQISTSSLARHVQSLVYLPDLLPGIRDVHEWAAKVESGREARGETSKFDEQGENIAFHKYQLYFQNQAELLDNSVDQLENLGRVAVYWTEYWEGGGPCHPFWEGAKIQELTIADMGGESGMHRRFDFPIFKMMTPAFLHLRHIDLSLELYVTEDFCYDVVSNIAEGFGNWLRSASLLETMIVTFLHTQTYEPFQDWDGFPFQPDYLRSLDTVVRSRLRKLVLRNYHTTERSLLRLICNQPSLQHLELNYIDFRLANSDRSGGSWESVFRTLGETKGPQLRSVKITEIADRKYNGAIIEDDDEESIKTVSDYIRFGGDVPVFVALHLFARRRK